MIIVRLGGAALALALAAVSAHAQSSDPSSPPSPTPNRTATTTLHGDTGFWLVPTAEVVARGTWSASVFRANIDRQEGVTDISHVGATFGYGLGDRAEVFGALQINTRIARRIRGPLFQAGEGGGPAAEYPFVREGWIGNHLGDLHLGAKLNLLSQSGGSPAAVAIRGIVKVPAGDDAEGASTGRPDLLVDAIASREIARAAELSAFGGLLYRGDPSGIDLPNAFRWGVGAAAPTRLPFRVFGELAAERRFSDDITVNPGLTAVDGSLSPRVSSLRHPVDGAVGLLWRHESGFFVDASMSFSLVHRSRGDLGLPGRFGDRVGKQIRLGYHPGVARDGSRGGSEAAAAGSSAGGAEATAESGTATAATPQAPGGPGAAGEHPGGPLANRPPTVKARCEPCTVQTGRSATVTAEAADPDGDRLTYRWSSPGGLLTNAGDRQTLWTAPEQEGAVPVTIVVDDGRGGTATDTLNIQVVRPPVREFAFEDVHFDFDRHSLRAEARRVLDEAVRALGENRELTVEVEGHTCSIGTAEYNLALGERRALSVREYLVSRGVSADRLRTVSYGEERPKHDNLREETRRLNRRASLVVRIR